MNQPQLEEPSQKIPPFNNKSPKNRLWKKIYGITLIVCGIFGVFLPFVPGLFLIIVGAYLLENKWMKNKVEIIINYFKKK